MLRLLYLLLEQRLRRRPDAPPAPAHVTRTKPAPAAILGGLLALVAIGAVLVYVTRTATTAPTAPVAEAGATLTLRVDAMGAAPFVVFLETPNAPYAVTDTDRKVTARLTSVNSAFQPMFQVASLTADIEVGNADPIPHNTHMFDGRRTVFNVATPAPGVRVRKVLRQPGLFHVRCDLHPWMRAWVFVPANPHYAVMWQPGTTTLRDVPPGEYRLHMWDPAAGTTSTLLRLAGGEKRALSFPGG